MPSHFSASGTELPTARQRWPEGRPSASAAATKTSPTDAYDLAQSKLAFRVAGVADDDFQVFRYRGTEGLSLLFRFDIEMSAPPATRRLDDLVGRPATFVLEAPGGVRRFHGVVGRFQYIGEHGEKAYYRAELMPLLWLLTHSYHSRIFQHKPVPQIVAEVLRAAGLLDASFKLEPCLINKHPPREYCVQYRETDYNFIARLMEDEGIFYFFEHDEHECRMVLSDSAMFRGLDAEDRSLPYQPPSGLNAQQPHVFHFQESHEVRPSRVVLRDYNYVKPSLDLQCHGGHGRDGNMEVSDYPGKYTRQADGHLIAQIRAEELECRGRTASGNSNCQRLAAGVTFKLRDHPNSACNAEYLVTRVVHQGRQAIAGTFDEAAGGQAALSPSVAQALDRASRHEDPAVRDLARCVNELLRAAGRPTSSERRALGLWLMHGGQVQTDPAALAAARGGDPLDWLTTLRELAGRDGERELGSEAAIYECEFECIPAEITFRPPRITPRPLMRGSQTALVVGPKGEEIFTDKLGRVKVQFYWDREGQRDEHSSCWIRVSQAWAGGGFGGLNIPRVGQEVIVDFLEGDSDQPIITGRVYNAEQMPPQSLPGSKARTSLRSNSYPGGGGSNEITMDDTKGQEHFYEKAQHDKTVEIGNNRNTSVGVDSTEVVGNNVTESVGNNKSTDVTNAYNVNCDTFLLNAKTSITLVCGAARIHMNQAGFISITGTVITSAATVNNSMVAPMTEVVGAVMLSQAGAVVLIEGGATHVRGEVLAALKGATVNAIANGDNVVQGGLVKIN